MGQVGEVEVWRELWGNQGGAARPQGLARIDLWAHLSVIVSDDKGVSSELLRLPSCFLNLTPGPLLINSNSEPCQEGGFGSILPSLTRLSQHNPVHQNISDVDGNITDQTSSHRRRSGSLLCMFISPVLVAAQHIGSTDQFSCHSSIYKYLKVVIPPEL